MKIKASRLYEIFPAYNQFASSPMDNAMGVKLAIASRAIRPHFDEIERGRNKIVMNHASPDPENKGTVKVLPAQLKAFNEELSQFWEKLGDINITRTSLSMEDLGKFGIPVAPNMLEIVIELCVDEPSEKEPA